MNILLVCAAGMSTSLLVTRMLQAAQAKGIEAEINAYPVSKVKDYGPAADVILLGPQVRYQLKEVQNTFPDKPSAIIDMKAYGMMDGESVLNTAIKLIEDAK